MNKKRKVPKILWSDWPDDFREAAINGGPLYDRTNPLINAARGRDESGVNEDELREDYPRSEEVHDLKSIISNLESQISELKQSCILYYTEREELKKRLELKERQVNTLLNKNYPTI